MAITAFSGDSTHNCPKTHQAHRVSAVSLTDSLKLPARTENPICFVKALTFNFVMHRRGIVNDNMATCCLFLKAFSVRICLSK
jgi:hypothetical protein